MQKPLIMKLYKKINTFIIAGSIVLAGCLKSVPDNNDPNQESLNNSPHDLEQFGLGAYYNFWTNTKCAPNIDITALVMADQFTASWANFGWLASSSEPRQTWDNHVSADNDGVTVNFYYGSYGVIVQVNTVIKKILIDKIQLNGGKDNAEILALSYLIQGISYGNLGLVFDKAYIVTENTKDINNIKSSGYATLRDTAIAALKKVITICDTSKFSIPGANLNFYTLSQDNLSELASSFIARYLVLTSRNAQENRQVDWLSVFKYSAAGLTYDFGTWFDNMPWDGGSWYDENLYYLVNLDWARVNNRILHLLDPAYPKQYPSSGAAPQVHSTLRPGEALSQDARLISDFQYLSSINFLPQRGTYYFSNYRYKRFDDMLFNNKGGTIYEFRGYENLLYLAEAYVMLQDNTDALGILNNPAYPRIARGKLAEIPSNSTSQTVLDAIFYERDIELMAQGFMLGFCDMRRRDMLQYGTPLHFPIPEKELLTLNIPYYTFGGVSSADGINTSNGGWFDVNGN